LRGHLDPASRRVRPPDNCGSDWNCDRCFDHAGFEINREQKSSVTLM